MVAVRVLLMAILTIFLLSYVSGRNEVRHLNTMRAPARRLSAIRAPTRSPPECLKGYRRLASGKCRLVFNSLEVGAFYVESAKFAVEMNTLLQANG
jgi:hypothetical protein